MFKVGDTIELTQNVFLYDKGLIAEVVEVDDGNANYGYVKILSYNRNTKYIGQIKHANLTLFKLVERSGFFV